MIFADALFGQSHAGKRRVAIVDLDCPGGMFMIKSYSAAVPFIIHSPTICISSQRYLICQLSMNGSGMIVGQKALKKS